MRRVPELVGRDRAGFGSGAGRLERNFGNRLPTLAALRQPADVKQFDAARLAALAADMRSFLIESVPTTGGHLGAGLGVVELTIALFAEFNFNDHDRLVWDVGHQCYPHKLLTGRAAQFGTLRQWGGLSGYPDPTESSFDTVKTGHGGTSISTAMGFALAGRRRGAVGGTAVAVIGDGALQEGSAWEALNHAGAIPDLPLVVVLNDNGMSISPSVGALHAALVRLRATDAVSDNRRPLFADLGWAYLGPIDGHDIAAVRMVLHTARLLRQPVLVHVVTEKGHDYKTGVPERTRHHAVPAPVSTAVDEYREQGGASFTAAFAEHAIAMAEQDPRIVVVTAAMLEGTGLHAFQQRFPDRCFDVGMAEQHAVAFAASLALGGLRPICAIYSTFLQRAYDQLFQEVALQRAPVLFCLDRAGLVGSDGATHNGVFDIGYLRCLPNFLLMQPRDTGELAQMMDLACLWDGPAAVRFPRGSGRRADAQIRHNAFAVGRAEIVAAGADGCILAYGPMTYAALDVRQRIRTAIGRTLTVVNARFAKPLDEELIGEQLERQPVVFTLEDHVAACGFGSAVAELAASHKHDTVAAGRLRILGVPDRFIDHGERCEQLRDAALDVDAVTRIVAESLSAQIPRRRLRRVAGSARS